MKRLLAAFLCGIVFVSSVGPAPTVYAAQEAGTDYDLTAADGSEGFVDDSEDLVDDGEALSEDIDISSGEIDVDSVEVLSDSDDGNPDGDDPTQDEEVFEGNDNQSIADTADDDAEKNTSKNELPEGVNGLPAGFTISPDHEEMKRSARSHDMLSSFEVMKADVDYAADEVITLADSREEAEAIAYAYSGELKEFSYGVATISLAGSGVSVDEAFELALDSNLELPYVEPNFVYTIEEPDEKSEIEDESNLLSESDDTVPAGRGFSDWWYGTDDPDPYLNPDNSLYQWHHGMINTYSAWGVTCGNSSVEVAVIDTGVNASHSDFTRDDGSKVIDSANGWNFVGNNSNFADDNGHGTHVAGIIAAALNGKLGAGVAPGVTILPLKVCKADGTYNDDEGGNSVLARAIKYAAGFNKDGSALDGVRANIINMSLGSTVFSAALEEAINEAHDRGCTLVAAMGNEDNSNAVEFPAAFENTIAVSSFNENGLVSWFSSVGKWADIAAPGSDIYSCSYKDSNAYVYDSGTSMAAPVVSGACALYMSAVGIVDPDTMKRVIRSSVSGSTGAGTGVGILDLARLFNGDTTAPKMTLMANDESDEVLGEVRDAKTYAVTEDVTLEAVLKLSPMNFGGASGENQNTKIVYTTDGKNPVVYDGKIVHGSLCENDNSILVESITGDALVAKTKVTVKAAAVTGMGVMSKVSTITFTVDPMLQGYGSENPHLEVELLNCPTNMVAGKSLKLTARVDSDAPNETVPQKVVWRIEKYENGDLSKAKINEKNGTLTTAPSQYGRLTISCTTENGAASATAYIYVTDLKPIKEMVLGDGKAVDLSLDSGERKYVSITKMIDAGNNDMIDNGFHQYVSHRWTSSNENVVKVEAYSYDPDNPKPPTASLIPVGAGTATVTCFDLNGSGKSAKITVRVSSDAKAESVRVCSGSSKEAISTLPMAIRLSEEKATLTAYYSYSGEYDNPRSAPLWKSSNPKVVRITPNDRNEDGEYTATLTALAKGNATITCLANDGSGRKATVKVVVSQLVLKANATGPGTIVKGASANYKAIVFPSTASNKAVELSLEDAPEGVTFSNGKVTVAETVPENTSFYIVAKALDDGGEEGRCLVRVAGKKADDVTMSAESGYLPSDKDSEIRVEYSEYAMFKAAANNGAGISFKSSNPKVMRLIEANIDGDGYAGEFRAVGRGTCKITATADDGSKKSASITVRVVTLSQSVEVTGQSLIAAGSKATFKASVLPADATDKKVSWTINPSGSGVSVNASGVVTVDSSVPAGKEFDVIAESKDGNGAQGIATFTTTALKVSKVTVTGDTDSEDPVRIPKYSDGSLTAFRLYDTNIASVDEDGEDQNIDDERVLLLHSLITSGSKLLNNTGVVWSSSNTKVAEIVEDGGKTAVVARKPGTATITCMADDGSKKKATIKVTVITPASGVFITAGKSVAQSINKNMIAEKILYLGYGVSMPVSVKVGDAYGKPTVTGTKTEYEYGLIAKDESFIPYPEKNQEIFRKTKFCMTYSGGKVSVKSKSAYRAQLKKAGITNVTDDELQNDYYMALRLTVTTTDGTGYKDTAIFRSVLPTTSLQVRNYDSQGTLRPFDASLIDITTNGVGVYCCGSVRTDGFIDYSFAVTSSNPDIASATVTYDKKYEAQDGGYMLAVTARKKGTVKITIQALDGTGKKKVYLIKVI